MDLEEARALKKKALEKFVAPMIEAKVKASSLSFAATDVRNTALNQPNRVMALGITRVKNAYGLAVRVQRRSLFERSELEQLKKMTSGELDVRFVGRIEKRAAPWYQSVQRPLLIGSSVSHRQVTAGTLGAFVRLRGEEEPLYILSNNHVLANENKAKIGDLIVQPGTYDGGRKKDAVGTLANFIKLKTKNNLVDCAIAEVDPKVAADLTKLKGLGKLRGVNPNVDIGMEVNKIGRTTGLTRGVVSTIELDDVVVAFGTGNISFNNQVEIESAEQAPFSDGGDSGSLIVDSEGQAVGLLFAGSEAGGSNNLGLTYANPIQAVFDALKIELA